MTLKEAYDQMGGDYDNVMARLGAEAIIMKIIGMFLKDNSLSELETAYAANDYKTIFMVTHNLKGVCANLGIARLGGYASELCEATRNGEPAVDIAPMMDRIRESYAVTRDTITALCS